MALRSQLQELLEQTLGSSNVYFQPPSNVQMQYPAIVYERDDLWVVHGDNRPYVNKLRYLVTVIDRNPDSLFPGLIAAMPLSRFSRHFVNDNLHHDLYTLYF